MAAGASAPPLPPGPTYFPPPPPGWGPGPMGFGSPPPPDPRQAERDAIGDARDAVSIYRWAIVLGLLVQVVTLIEVLSYPAAGRAASLSSVTGGAGSEVAGGLSGPVVALAAIASLLGLVIFVLSLVAFLRWRGAISTLRTGSPPYFGGYPPPPGSSVAAEAVQNYRRSVYTLLLWLVTIIVGIAALVVVAISAIAPKFNANGSLSPTNATAGLSPSAAASILVIGVALGLVLLLIDLLLAYFVTASLGAIARLGGPAAETFDVEGARWLVLIGVLLGAGGLLGTVYAPLVGIAILGGICLLLGTQRYYRELSVRAEGA